MSERIELLNGLGWAELGCWIDGHWGQYGPDRLVSIAVMHGWDVSPDDDELVLMAQARLDDIGTGRTAFEELCEKHGLVEDHALECIVSLSEDAEQYLNDQCPDGYSFGWHDGEFYLWDDDDWKETP